jgi:hypothetical protein
MFSVWIIVFSFFFGLFAGQEYISLLAGIMAYFVVFGGEEYENE